MNVKFKILLFLLLPVLACAHQGDTEFKRTVSKEFNVNSGAQLNVHNKYGKIIIHTWSQNQVKATIVITGFGKNTSEAQEIANAVDIQASGDPGTVTFQTNYSSKGGKWFWGGNKDSKDYVNIDYEIYVPKSLGMLSLENSFGDVITDQLPFAAKMRLNYCFYAIREAGKTLEMDMNYCSKGRIDKAGELVIKANYSDIRCEAADKLDSRSNYCDYTIGNIGSLTVRANYSDYKIRQLGSINATGNYSDFSVSSLQDRADLKLTYSDVKLKDVSAAFKGGYVNLTYSDLEMTLSNKVALKLDVHLTYGDLETGGLSLKNISSIKKSQNLTYSATTASGGEGSPVLEIRGVRSDVELDAK
ncbi:hypothetical protein [uncultured Chitinophaga sp.]|jgi:hypothetical protein|uniref:hypothetical protein n=1 Tax=uncultured Chitinophaga sp. TaxID=339340 RepID=UPI002603D0E1|nr:hypothetical protein [uncultured Chitinophaga sp.]